MLMQQILLGLTPESLVILPLKLVQDLLISFKFGSASPRKCLPSFYIRTAIPQIAIQIIESSCRKIPHQLSNFCISDFKSGIRYS